MRQFRVKIGESALMVNEKGELCELINIPINLLKGQILEFYENEEVEQLVTGLFGKFGNIHFKAKKK